MLDLTLVIVWNIYVMAVVIFVLYLHVKHRPLSWRELLFFVTGTSIPVIPMIGLAIN